MSAARTRTSEFMLSMCSRNPIADDDSWTHTGCTMLRNAIKELQSALDTSSACAIEAERDEIQSVIEEMRCVLATAEIDAFALSWCGPLHDFSADTPGNGYRAILKVTPTTFRHI